MDIDREKDRERERKMERERERERERETSERKREGERMTREEVVVIEKLSVVKLFNLSQKFVNQFHARRTSVCSYRLYILYTYNS